ncbi:type II toxin-antitoxin system HipA family toxin [Marichromatium gracile]|uniref:Serine/threonine-protein kinase HipA n=1 Tax=Marichromatium gracile TaxID=1048 RepID=A0A4R4AKZ3_MARGR|nr:HipA domain-containing protein [Marichromatium gracile]MBK1710753.1 hypothetical protein [Marichromatium gracile]TCW40097.1 serine/threonine-protein kinase HipA [Marichromatium gracile]
MSTSLVVTLDWLGERRTVGQLDIFTSQRGTERYQFTYDRDWCRAGFAIDPDLDLLPGMPFQASKLWGAFQDIAPDRWGRLVQDRVLDRYLNESDYLLGVSDHMRMGALRLSLAETPGEFLALTTDVPKLVHLRALEAAIERLEQGVQTDTDLALLAQPGSSLGGAHPKAAIEDKGKLYIAKFQSRLDTERVGAWEATVLDLAGAAGLRVAKHRLLNANGERPVLLVERFDRQQGGRVPFASAMTLAARDEQSADAASYLELADVIKATSAQPKLDQVELWRRMTFNALCGNTDDHLRNHGFLREPQGWRLSPAYDLNPDRHALDRRRHALSFDGEQRRPSLQLCLDLADYFGVDETIQAHALGALGKALTSWQDLAKHNGLRGEEIKRMSGAFEHADTERLQALTVASRQKRSRGR